MARAAISRTVGRTKRAARLRSRSGASSATYGRLDALTAGLEPGLTAVPGVPLIVAGQGDVGGLIGMHIREAARVASPIASIDGIESHDFDYVDVGALIPASGSASFPRLPAV
jgi:ethanolamine utilization protein EutA (predicted chaperonin)